MSLIDSYTRTDGELRLTNHVQLELMRAVLGRGLPFRFEALGFSMTPFIQHHDFITITPIKARAIRIGDVLAFVQAEKDYLTVHRVIEIRPEQIILRGDNNLMMDLPVTPENILGVVTRVERDGHSKSLGLGVEKRLIAWLNARNWLSLIRQVFSLPRQLAARLLPKLQGIAVYRLAAKKLTPDYLITNASASDLIEVQARMNPGMDFLPQKPTPGVSNSVARHGKKLLGFVQYVRHPQENFPYVGAWLFSLLVFGAYRGMGIGESLTRRVIEQAQEDGAPELRLLVKADNSRAILLYQKLGFEFIDPPEFEQLLKVEEIEFCRRRRVMRYTFPPSKL